MLHQDPAGFVRDSAIYGPIGKTVTALSDMEWQHDHLILEVNRIAPQLAHSLSHRFPRQFKEKTDFVIEILWHLPALRRLPLFGDGSLNTVWLQYQLDELYDIRSSLAHGSVALIEKLNHGCMWNLSRTTVPSKRTVSKQWTTVGDGFLADVVVTAKHISLYFSKLSQILTGESDPEQEYQQQKNIYYNRKKWLELIEVGAVEPDCWDRAIFGLGE